MRLIDRVIGAPAAVELIDGAGHNRYVPGVGEKAADVRACELRYILDRAASEEMMNLVKGANNGLFDPESPLLRMPAEAFWMEWFGAAADHPKLGILVEADRGGRTGTITGYFEASDGQPDKVGACVSFNLDAATDVALDTTKMRHANLRHLDRLLSCVALHIEPGWDQFFRDRDGMRYGHTIKDLASNCWYFLPVACAFAAMLNSRDVLVETSSNLERLNAARHRRGSPPLLDHIEISLRLGRGRSEQIAGSAGRSKAAPRLHHVRGHLVQRAGKTFWRSAHLRGDAARPIIQKTVRVNAPRRFAARLTQRHA